MNKNLVCNKLQRGAGYNHLKRDMGFMEYITNQKYGDISWDTMVYIYIYTYYMVISPINI